jgi:hypothetical protein
MKKSILLITAMFAMALSIAVNAQSASSTAMATASATIINPLSIMKNSDLVFGNIASGSSWGSVTINTDGSRWANGGVTLIESGNYNSAASFGITGYPYATYSISLPYSVSITNGSSWMEVNSFVTDMGYYNSLDWYGNGYMNVGATLNVNPGQEPGYYTGSFDVTISLN